MFFEELLLRIERKRMSFEYSGWEFSQNMGCASYSFLFSPSSLYYFVVCAFQGFSPTAPFDAHSV